MNKLPKAKLENIVVQDLGIELLVYNLTTHKAYTLNETSKLVYQSCDGATTFDELKRKYSFTDDLIHFALDELKVNDLLIDYRGDHFAGLSRRAVIKRIGFASTALIPVVFSLVAPVAVKALSCPSRNAPNGCPSGSISSGTSCSATSDAQKDTNCGAVNPNCQSRHSVYAGDCAQTSGNRYSYSCVCAA